MKSEATGQGDVVLVQGDGTVAGINETPDNLDSQGRPSLVDANEVMRVSMMPADTAGPSATAFDDGADATDDDALVALAKSPLSTRPTLRPLSAASQAIDAPEAPPPMISTSNAVPDIFFKLRRIRPCLNESPKYKDDSFVILGCYR